MSLSASLELSQNLISKAGTSSGQLRRRYVAALALLAILIIFSQVIMQSLIESQKYDSHVINIAGRQRMLSQKITKLTYYILNADPGMHHPGFREELRAALTLFENSQVALRSGNDELDLPGKNSAEVNELFGLIKLDHDAIVNAARVILSSERRSTLIQSSNVILQHEAGFLDGMNKIVFRYDQESKARVDFSKWLEIGLMATMLLVLMLEGVFIFAPATLRIHQEIQELGARENALDHLFEASPTPMLLVDKMDLAILRVNTETSKLLGFPSDEMVGSNLKDYFDLSRVNSARFVEKIEMGKAIDEYEVAIFNLKHSILETLVSVRPIVFFGKVVFVIGITDVTELKKSQHLLEYFATCDEMTGMSNRRSGMMLLGKSMAQLGRKAGRLTVCFVDLDGLKIANDNFGHTEGDWLIITAAEALAGEIRTSDAAVRLGGDEFLLILHNSSRDDASRILARAEARMKKVEGDNQKKYSLGFSYGIAVFDANRHSAPDELIAEADSQMYRAKQEKKAARLTLL